MADKKDLRPTKKQLVREIAEEVGISVEGWGSNDRHRNSQWCFGKSVGPNLAFFWWKNLREDHDGNIYFLNDAGDYADKCRRKGKAQAATKAEALNNLILTCYYQKRPLTVAIVDGSADPDDEDAQDKAERRELDHVLWYPHHIDSATGFISVMRGVAQAAGFDPMTGTTTPEAEVKPADEPEPDEGSKQEDDAGSQGEAGKDGPSEKTTVTTTAYARDTEVVKAVKRRAADGKCECCGKQGFETARGGYYLEVHHVIPLECDGPDAEWNALAICPDEHKQAHFGANRNELRDVMICILGEQYPGRLAQLQELARKMDMDAQAAEDLETDFAT